ILRIHQRGVVGRDRHVEPGVRFLEGVSLLFGQVDDLLELLEGGHPVALLPAPVVPVLVRDVHPGASSSARGKAIEDVLNRSGIARRRAAVRFRRSATYLQLDQISVGLRGGYAHYSSDEL